MLKLYLGHASMNEKDNLLVFNGSEVLHFIDNSNIFLISLSNGVIIIKLPYVNLKFKLELNDEEISKHIFHNYLYSFTQLEETIKSYKFKNTLSCNLKENKPSLLYEELAEKCYDSSILTSFAMLINNNPDFKLKYFDIEYKMGHNIYKYPLLSPKDLKKSEYEIKNSNPPFFETSVTWCNKNVNGRKCVLICSSLLYNSSTNILEISKARYKLTLKILGYFQLNTATMNIMFYSMKESQLRVNKKGENLFSVEIDLSIFYDVLKSFNSTLKESESYFSFDFCTKIIHCITAAFKCSQELSKGNNVVIEDTDDTPVSFIIGSLTKILVDANYCTFDGFIRLIRDDWINRGYFYIIGDETDKRNDILKNRLHFFYVWLTCVQLLLYKYPIIFEFTYWMIHYIINNLWTDRFYPFSWNCPDGDIFDRLISKRDKLINYGYYLNKSPQIYGALVEEIKTVEMSENQYDETLKTILTRILPQFLTETKTLDLDNYKYVISTLQSQIYFKTGETSKFILSSFHDPDAERASAALTKPPLNAGKEETPDYKQISSNEVKIDEKTGKDTNQDKDINPLTKTGIPPQ